MVTHLNIALDDDLADEARAVKDRNGWTWEEFVSAAVEEFENGDE